jgi:transposase
MKKTTTLAIDIAKEKFHIFGVDKYNKPTIDKLVNRKKLIATVVNLQPVDIYMESCAGSNYLCHKFNNMGHNSKRISAQHVKPYASHQKNDRNDAMAILEASRRPGALFVSLKSLEQKDLQSLHKIRDQAQKQYKAIINQIRGLLFEYGIVIPKSVQKFKKNIPEILENAELSLSLYLREEIKELFIDFRRLETKVKSLESTIHQMCKGSEFYQKAQNELKGVGPLSASRFMCTIGSYSNFKNGRQVSACLGVVPRQNSSGGKTSLGGITKHGDVGLRTMIIQGARASMAALSRKEYLNDEDKKIINMIEKKGFNKTAVALANRNIRQMWAIMKKCA